MHETSTLRQTATLIGCELHTSDRFVRDALDWLARHSQGRFTFHIDDDVYCVEGPNWIGRGESWPTAFASAIHSFHAAREAAIHN